MSGFTLLVEVVSCAKGGGSWGEEEEGEVDKDREVKGATRESRGKEEKID